MSIGTYIKRGLQYFLHGNPVIFVNSKISYLSPNERLTGKKIIITGGGRGLGLSMAERFIAEGANVLISGRTEETLREAAARLGCQYLVFDVCDAASAANFIEDADRKLGGANVLVNNAGISLHECNIKNVSINQFNLQINTNLRGGYFLTQKFIEQLKNNESPRGNILFISSERGFQADDIPYGLTKAAINSLVKGLAPSLIKEGIRINAVAPGITTSDMTGYRKDGNLYCAANPNNRVYLPEEVAEVASFLISDASACISGQIIVCNEGKTGNSKYMYR